ncbi:regulatory protein [Laceyella sediminis]|uniref:Regulatory protein RecX n=1 Tax=Laceyella sediminis TaxID=573074 RepID=A0ABX5EQC8_9BACL|nr:RecX family transcriptional regulator [Laceyella sediminis]PRZ15486.1 regulatory protein [Laceyella sediminis]
MTNYITRIEKCSKQAKRYRIFVDGTEVCSVHEDVLVKFHLYKGMEMEPSQLEELLQEEEYNKVKQAVMRYLSYKPRTVYEVKQHLNEKGYEAALGEQAIKEMEAQGFLDDRQYAKSWVAERHRHKGYGTLRLRQELTKKGVASSHIDEALAEMDEEEQRQLAMKIAERRYLRICGEPWPTIERRLGQYLLRQGYPVSLVYEILREFRDRDEAEKGNG